MNNNENVAKGGFYYHYKHTPEGDYNNYAYKVLGLARHSESEEMLVLYRPVYDNKYLKPADCTARPLDVFLTNVNTTAGTRPRFERISDLRVVTSLQGLYDRMYGENSPSAGNH
jgi:hypothetical protein